MRPRLETPALFVRMASSQVSPGSEAASSSGVTSATETSRFSTFFAYVRRTHFCAALIFGLSRMPGPVHGEYKRIVKVA